MLSSNEAHSITRNQLFDLKLSSVQQGVVQLLERSSRSTEEEEQEERARMERFEMSLQGMGIDLREVVDGLRLKTLSPPPVLPVGLPGLGGEVGEGGEGEKKALLLEEVNGKLDGILEMFERLEKASASAAQTSTSTMASLGGAVVVSGQTKEGEGEIASRVEGETMRAGGGPPPVKPIEGLPGGKMFVVNPLEGSVVSGEEVSEGDEREMMDQEKSVSLLHLSLSLFLFSTDCQNDEADVQLLLPCCCLGVPSQPIGASSVLSNGTVASLTSTRSQAASPLSLPVAAEVRSSVFYLPAQTRN